MRVDGAAYLVVAFLLLEIPKPNWLAYDAKFYGMQPPDEAPMTVQDRAYTSPIWYTP